MLNGYPGYPARKARRVLDRTRTLYPYSVHCHSLLVVSVCAYVNKRFHRQHIVGSRHYSINWRLQRDRYSAIKHIRHSKTPEWLGWTVTGPNPAEGRFFFSGRACAMVTLPGGMTFRVSIFTAPDPHGSGRLDMILPHPHTASGSLRCWSNNGDRR